MQKSKVMYTIISVSEYLYELLLMTWLP